MKEKTAVTILNGKELYTANNPDWLKSQKKKLIAYIHDELGWTHVKDLIIECKN